MNVFKITAVTLAAALPMMAAAQTSSTAGSTGMGESGAATAESSTAAPAAATTAAPVATTTTVAPVATTVAPVTVPADGAAPMYVETLTDIEDDAKVTARLTEAGYTDIKVTRADNKLTVEAVKDGTPQNLEYDVTTGALTTVDGAGYKVGGGVTDQTGDNESTAVQH